MSGRKLRVVLWFILAVINFTWPIEQACNATLQANNTRISEVVGSLLKNRISYQDTHKEPGEGLIRIALYNGAGQLDTQSLTPEIIHQQRPGYGTRKVSLST